jgi:hypothetical protein
MSHFVKLIIRMGRASGNATSRVALADAAVTSRAFTLPRMSSHFPRRHCQCRLFSTLLRARLSSLACIFRIPRAGLISIVPAKLNLLLLFSGGRILFSFPFVSFFFFFLFFIFFSFFCYLRAKHPTRILGRYSPLQPNPMQKIISSPRASFMTINFFPAKSSFSFFILTLIA